ncbi:ABC transporter [Colletotrichum salicis]|uniref:ABC transporter n=1 Tax=Colletotrichum salicis TaxID=1209931 RepID=A0A135US60_9PEZI|nr:ABC transporter [Colletotrichum salicis]
MFVLILPKSSQSLHWTLLQPVMRAPLSFFGSTDTGDLINSQDLSHIDRDLPSALFMTSIGEWFIPHTRQSTKLIHRKGQKQQLCLARAIVRKNSSKVLVLDEATSAIDQETEDMMARIIESEFADHTIISVVHRPQALRSIDRIVTVQDGRVASIGTVEH